MLCCSSLFPVPSHWLLVLGMGAKVEQDCTNNGVKSRAEGSVSNWELPRRVGEGSSLSVGCSGSPGFAQKDLGRRSDSIKNNWNEVFSLLAPHLNCRATAAFSHYSQAPDKSIFPQSLWTPASAELQSSVAARCFCDALLHGAQGGKWRCFLSLLQDFSLFPSPQCSQFRAGSGIFLFICTLKVRADFALCLYHMLQMPLRCFFLCYLQILRCIDFWVFSKGLKISAVTLKPSEIIDYLFLPPLQLLTSCPSMEKCCPISRWFTVKQIFAEL